MKNKMNENMGSGSKEMISEDNTSHANLPTSVKQVDYPKRKYVNDKYLNDTIEGIDKNANDSVDKFNNKDINSRY